MWKLVALLVLVACKSESKDAAKPATAEPVVAKTALDAKPAVVKPERAKLTKAQLADVRKHMKAGWAAQKDKRWADAVTEFEAALKIADGDARLLTELGWSAMNAGDYAKAKKADDASVKAAVAPKLKAAGLYNLGLVQLKLGDTAGARASFTTSLALRPNKTVEAELAKVGGAVPKDEAGCAPTQSACECAIAATDTVSDDPQSCQPSTTTKSPVPGWKVYTVATGHGTAEVLLDEHHQVVTTIGNSDDRMRHMEVMTLEKAELKTIAGHKVIWLEVTDNDHTQMMEEQEVVDDDYSTTRATICTVGDAKTPTQCALRDAPKSDSHAIDRTVMLDDGTMKDGGKHEDTTTELDIAIGDDGVVTVKLAKGSAQGLAADLLGPHKLW